MTAETDALVNVVATAILDSLRGDEADEDIADDEWDGACLAAHAAINAHDQWLIDEGFTIVPKGCVAVPRSDEEAAAMATAVQAYQQAKSRKAQLLTTPKLILPPTVQ
jgi:hypothetical protein